MIEICSSTDIDTVILKNVCYHFQIFQALELNNWEIFPGLFPNTSPPPIPTNFWKFVLLKWYFLHFERSFECNLKVSDNKFDRETHFGRKLRSFSFNILASNCFLSTFPRFSNFTKIGRFW